MVDNFWEFMRVKWAVAVFTVQGWSTLCRRRVISGWKNYSPRQVSEYIQVKKLNIEAGVGIFPGEKVAHWSRCPCRNVYEWKVLHWGRYRDISEWKSYTSKQASEYIQVERLYIETGVGIYPGEQVVLPGVKFFLSWLTRLLNWLFTINTDW